MEGAERYKHPALDQLRQQSDADHTPTINKRLLCTSALKADSNWVKERKAHLAVEIVKVKKPIKKISSEFSINNIIDKWKNKRPKLKIIKEMWAL